LADSKERAHRDQELSPKLDESARWNYRKSLEAEGKKCSQNGGFGVGRNRPYWTYKVIIRALKFPKRKEIRHF